MIPDKMPPMAWNLAAPQRQETPFFVCVHKTKLGWEQGGGGIHYHTRSRYKKSLMGRCRALKIPTLNPYLNSSRGSYYTPSPSKLSMASAFNIALDLFPPNREHSDPASAPYYPPNTLVPIFRRMIPCPKLTGLNTNQERFSIERASSHTFRSDHLTTSDTFWYCIGAKDVWWNHSKPLAGSQSIPL